MKFPFFIDCASVNLLRLKFNVNDENEALACQWLGYKWRCKKIIHDIHFLFTTSLKVFQSRTVHLTTIIEKSRDTFLLARLSLIIYNHYIYNIVFFRLELTTKLQQWFPTEIWLKSIGLFACCPTPQPSGRRGPGWTTSLTSCTQREPSFTGEKKGLGIWIVTIIWNSCFNYHLNAASNKPKIQSATISCCIN